MRPPSDDPYTEDLFNSREHWFGNIIHLVVYLAIYAFFGVLAWKLASVTGVDFGTWEAVFGPTSPPIPPDPFYESPDPCEPGAYLGGCG